MMRGRGGTADALASGASGGNPVEVQILSTAPILYCNNDFSLCGCGGTADAPSWGGGGETRVGSNPTNRTILKSLKLDFTCFEDTVDFIYSVFFIYIHII